MYHFSIAPETSVTSNRSREAAKVQFIWSLFMLGSETHARHRHQTPWKASHKYFAADKCTRLWPIQGSNHVVFNELHRASQALQAIADNQKSTAFFLGSVVRTVIFGIHRMAPAYYWWSKPTLISAVLIFPCLKTPVKVQRIYYTWSNSVASKIIFSSCDRRMGSSGTPKRQQLWTLVHAGKQCTAAGIEFLVAV